MIQSKKWIIGILALLTLVGLYFVTKKLEDGLLNFELFSKDDATITFEEETLSYDGTGLFDAMNGVSAKDADGTDLTNQLNSIIVSEGNQKYVQYSVSGENGKVVYAKRKLELINYQKPSLEVRDSLQLDASELSSLITYLHDEGLLKATDGFSQDVTSAVTYCRTKKSKGRYEIVFSYTNAFHDTVTQTVNASISGDVSDPEITLSQSSVTIAVGSEFLPTQYLVSATDGPYAATDRVQVTSYVNTAVAGNYRVVYELTSGDGTAYTSASLEVEVR